MKGSYFSFRFHTHLIKVSMIFLEKRVIVGFFTPFLVNDFGALLLETVAAERR